MRLLDSVLRSRKNTTKPPRQFVAPLLGRMLCSLDTPPFAICVATALITRGPVPAGTTPTWTGSRSTSPPSPRSSLLSLIRPWASPPVSCPHVASTPMALMAAGTVAIAARHKGSPSRRGLGSIARLPAPTASGWNRHHPALIPLSRRPPAWRSLGTTSAGWSRRLMGASGVTWSPMALPAHSQSSLAGWTWGGTRGVSGEPRPIGVISLRGPSAEVQVATRLTMATGTSTTDHALTAATPKMHPSCCRLGFSTMCRGHATCWWWSSSLPHPIDRRSSCARTLTWSLGGSRAMTRRAGPWSVCCALPHT